MRNAGAIRPFFVAIQVIAAAQVAYHRPPDAIAAIMEEAPTPTLQISPTREYGLLVGRAKFRSIGALALPMLPLAGIRINPENNGPARPLPIVSLKLINLRTDEIRDIVLPQNAKAFETSWAPDGKRFAVEGATTNSILIAIGKSEEAPSHSIQLKSLKVFANGAYGQGYRWMPDGHTLLVREVPQNRSPAPVRPAAPEGPEVQESLGIKRPAVTLPDALKDTLGERQFEYYMSCRLSLVDAVSGAIRQLGKPGVITASPSPDGKMLLVDETVHPYSRKLYSNGFPRKVSVWNLASGQETKIADQPTHEGVPLNGVPSGPRDIEWRSDRPETLVWVEALDGGDPQSDAELRDKLVEEDVSTGTPHDLIKFNLRFRGIEWTAKGNQEIVTEYDYDREHNLRWLVNVDDPSAPRVMLSDLSTRERYADPGRPVMQELPSGASVLLQDGQNILLEGAGAGPAGDHPFLDRLNLATREKQRIWQCDADRYERLVGVVTPNGSSFVTLRESPTDVPNYFIHSGSTLTRLTTFSNKHPDVLGVTRRVIKYKRADGVDLSFTLYLPPGYKEGDKLPAVVEAYPLEFTDASTAGEVNGSSKTYPTLRGDLYFLLAGYAVMDNVAMPIVGNPRTVNDTFIDQLVSDAKAAVDAADATGAVDTSRLGVMGHSYGAFMTANLLAHCDLFKAGAAESGAYNRTLTPFGFQSERRTFWQAPEMYLKVSPFAYADKIKHPILLIHGLQDDNPGTYTIQSERLYQAISGQGGTTRLVLLPYEAHGYAAKETIEHVFWEELEWFDKYVKG